MKRIYLITGNLLLIIFSFMIAFNQVSCTRQVDGQSVISQAAEQVTPMDEICDLIFTGENAGDDAHTTSVGDIDGDGYEDLIVGAWHYNSGQGRVYLYYGGPDMDNKPDLVFDGEPNAASEFGWLHGCGDVDNDGFDDIVISANAYNKNRGRAYLYYGGPRATMDAKADLIFDGETEGSMFAGASWDEIIVEDIDGDSFADIVFPAAAYNSGQGRAYLYWGSSRATMDAICDLTFTPPDTGGAFSIGMACGDIDNDGFKDIVIGAIDYPHSSPRPASGYGRAYLYWGGTKENMDADCDLIFDAESAEIGNFGSNVGIGDIDNDGYKDVIIGANWYENIKGRAYLYWGDAKANMDTTCDLTFTGETARSGFAELCISNGDVNADGYTDILIGARQYNNQRGRAYIFFGNKRKNMDAKADLVFTGENERDWFGDPPGGNFGDFNNDGFDDIVIGARRYPKNKETGRVYLYFGGPVPKHEDKHLKTLHQAVADSDIKQVKLLISKGVDVNAKNENDKTPLHYAAETGKKEIVELLISKGADVNCKDKDGQTPASLAMAADHKSIVNLLVSKGTDISLHLAAYLGDIAKVTSFIEKGADVNTKDGKNKTPLHYAAQAGKIEMVQLLVKAGADINVDKNDWPPLCIAAEKNHIEVVEYLIAHGADVNAGGDWTALQQAPYSSNIEMTKLLIAKGANINAGVGEWTVLHGAVEEGRRDIAELLIQNGVDINAKGKGGYLPLYYAIRRNDLNMTKLLIAKGADIHTKDSRGYTPLHWAVKMDDRIVSKKIAEILLSKGADVNAKDNDGATPLFYAFGQRDIAKLLIAKGADVNVKDNNSYTPLYYASEQGQKDLVEMILAKNVDINVRTKYGRTALHAAAEKGHNDLVKLLISKGASIDMEDKNGLTPILSAACYGHWDVVKLPIEKGANVSVKDCLGHALLHKAAEQGQKDVAELLIDKGSDINARDKNEDTPLLCAAYQGYKAVAELLLAKGADVNAKNKWDWTPLHRLAARGHKNMAKLLIAKGADVNAKDKDDRTPLWWAKEKGHEEIVKLLLKHGAKE